MAKTTSTQKPDSEMAMMKKEFDSMKQAYECLKPLLEVVQKGRADFSKTVRSPEANNFWDIIRKMSKEHDQLETEMHPLQDPPKHGETEKKRPEGGRVRDNRGGESQMTTEPTGPRQSKSREEERYPNVHKTELKITVPSASTASKPGDARDVNEKIDIGLLTKQNNELQKKNAQIDQLQNEKRDMKSQIKQMEENNNVLTMRHTEACANLKEACANLKKKNEDCEALIETRNEHLKLLLHYENALKKNEESLEERDRTIRTLGTDLEKLNKEYNDVKSRSTESPEKVDLSDPNRPTRLAEKFFELYSNEWRDCYTTVTGHYESQTSVIQMLLRTCVKIYSHCQMIASDDLNALKRVFTLFSGDSDDHLMSQMKQRRRCTCQVDIDLRRVKTGIEEKIEDIFGPDLIKHKHVQAFWMKCLDICWRMVILNPPVVMDTEINKKGQLFDNAKYHPYSQTGDVIGFIVWPVLYTHQGGDILSRGVAQGLVTTDSVGGKRRK